MTNKAREVLDDCRKAVSEIKDGVMGRKWRIRWASSVVLLRAVGHVLKKVDAARDPTLGQVIHQEWMRLNASKPEPLIFWKFIEEERNNILKEYKIVAGQGVTIRPGSMHLNLTAGNRTSESNLPTLYHYTINSGPFAGRDQREVLHEAIEWWQKFLDRIDTEYMEDPAGPHLNY